VGRRDAALDRARTRSYSRLCFALSAASIGQSASALRQVSREGPRPRVGPFLLERQTVTPQEVRDDLSAGP